ncbi:MAG: MaoC family dehydratase [Kordiimonadaceae bacterium]|nr:MaoC family dehydratase [Kordiimonadaceae bacterium]
MPTLYFEDMEIGRIQNFGSYKVTKEEMLDFAGKYDPQSFHTDEEAAKKSVFGALCTSGWHTGAMTMSMLVANMKATGFASLGSPGLDNLNWKLPVFAGDVLSVQNELIEKRESKSRPNLGLVKIKQKTLNQKGETVMELTANAMVAKRPV